MQYSLDEIKPSLNDLKVDLLPCNDLILNSWRWHLARILPEVKRIMLERCRQQCEHRGCDSLCESGLHVAWGLAKIRFNNLVDLN